MNDFKLKYEDLSGPPNKPDTLHIDFNKGKVKGGFNVITFVDKDTKQFVIYSPGLDVSAYGETQEKAQEMFEESAISFYKWLIAKTRSQIEKELTKLGWKKNKLRNKDFSKAFVDMDGTLQNFNAEENSVKRITLVS